MAVEIVLSEGQFDKLHVMNWNPVCSRIQANLSLLDFYGANIPYPEVEFHYLKSSSWQIFFAVAISLSLILLLVWCFEDMLFSTLTLFKIRLVLLFAIHLKKINKFYYCEYYFEKLRFVNLINC